jgi:hypothetical protein
MLQQRYRRQMTMEADRASQRVTRRGLSVPGIITREETVVPQPPELYRAPSFLAKTATPELTAELDRLLAELWRVNQDFVGEKNLEVQAYFTATGEHRDLERRFWSWCDSYFGHRASDPRLLNPQNHNDPLVLMVRLWNETMSIFGGLHYREQTINVYFLQSAMQYAGWVLYNRLWKNAVLHGKHHLLFLNTRTDPKTAAQVAGLVRARGYADGHLGRFLRSLRAWATSERVAHLTSLTDVELRGRLAAMAADMQEMRPFLVRNFRPSKVLYQLTGDLAVAWRWSIGYGIALVTVGTSLNEVIRNIGSSLTRLNIAVNHDGLLIDPRLSWLPVCEGTAIDGVPPLVLNCCLLELFHKRLFSFYDQIDFTKIAERQRARARRKAGPQTIEVSCRILAETSTTSDDDEAPHETNHRWVRPLRSQSLLRMLERKLGCEVRQGKGSEITIFREGGRIFTLGHHKQNDYVRPDHVKRILARVGISVEEWLGAVYR